MIAITRIDGLYSIGDTVTRHRGMYKEDGTFLSGDKVLAEEEAGFRIFLQQSPLPEKQARKEWNKKRATV